MRDPDADTRRGNPWLLAVLVVVAVLLTTAWFREGDDGVLHRARTMTMQASRPVAIAGDYAAAPVRSVTGFLSGLGATRAELEELQSQNDELRARLAELEEAGQENERLRRLVDFVETQDLDYLGARVIGRPTNSWDGSIQIDRGSDDGLTPGTPVIAAQGLVGQIVEAAPTVSRVRLVTDPRSGVAAIIQSTRASGVAQGTVEGGILVDFVAWDLVPEVGDVVLTSGMGGVYPKGLVVGDVVEVKEERHRLYPTIMVSSRVPLNETEEVLVILGPLPVPDLGAGE